MSVSNALIMFYFKSDESEAVGCARQVFNEMRGWFDGVWNVMISECDHHGLVSDAFEKFRRMRSMGIRLDEFTYTSVLSDCANSRCFKNGKALHAHIIPFES